MFRLGYNTNGLAHHRLDEALELLAGLGYEAVAITPDVGALDPFRLDRGEVERVRETAGELGLELALESGARFLLDPRRKHQPTLLDPAEAGRARRLDHLKRTVDLASELGAGIVSIWSGAFPDPALAPHDELLMQRLASELTRLIEHARGSGIRIAFEPEPGMFIERPSGYLELVRQLGPLGAELGLTLDVGHLLVTGDLPVGRQIRELSGHLIHVHLDDIRGGVHEHRMFGTGDLDLRETLSALLDVGYSGMAAVELSRDSHRGAQAAGEALEHLRAALAHTT